MSVVSNATGQTDDSPIKGFSEAGICTADFTPWIELFCLIGGWQQRWQGSMSAAALRLWDLPANVTGEECLLTRQGQTNGGIRLFKLKGM